MSQWLDEEIHIDVRTVSLPLGNMISEDGGRRQPANLRKYVSLWMLNRIPGLGFERQPIILRGRAAQGAAVRIRDETITRRELLYRFHKEYGIVMDMVRVGSRICIRCRSKEYIDVMGD